MNNADQKPQYLNLPVLLYRALLRLFLSLYLFTAAFFSFFRRARKADAHTQANILVTGTFYSDNWLLAHLLPLSLSDKVKSVTMVAVTPVPETDKIRGVYPPKILQKMIGKVFSRLLTFMWLSMRSEYNCLAAFHLLLNGLAAGLMGKIFNKPSIYYCGGGPREVLGGGYLTENRIFNKIKWSDPALEKKLLKAVNYQSLIVTMGKGAVEFFQQHDSGRNFAVMPGSFDPEVFYPGESDCQYDLIIIGRISQVKRIDLFLEAVRNISVKGKSIKAVVVGEGPLFEPMKSMAQELGVHDNVEFAGWQNNIGDWLRKSKIFVLTSDSEGLSQAMMQALMCGLPCVVADVGDLGELVRDDYNGFLIKERNAEAFSEVLYSVLEDDKLYQRLKTQALESSRYYQLHNAAKRWNEQLEKLL